MNNLNRNDIVTMPYNFKETQHRSRKRLGYHVFLSRYVTDFKEMPKIQQLQIVKGQQWVEDHGGANLRNPGLTDGDEDSDFSVATYDEIAETCVRSFELVSCAGAHWRFLSLALKEAWKLRALRLNKRALPAKFTFIPHVLKEDFKSKVLQSLTNEWFVSGTNMKRSIMKAPRRELSAMVYVFGSERIELLSKTYRVFYMSDLLKECIFGDNFSKLKKSEILTRSKRQVLIHIASNARIKKLFSLNSFTSVCETLNGKVYSCAGKVSVIKNGREMLGYILSESGNSIKVVLANNTTVELDRPKFRYSENTNKFQYIFPSAPARRYRIIEYNPIRIIVKADGTVRYILNRYSHNINDGSINEAGSA